MEDTQFNLKVSPKGIFVAGVFSGILLLVAILFVAMIVKGGSFGNVFAGSLERQPLAAANPSAPSAPSAAGDGTQAAGPVAAVTKDDHMRGDTNAAVTLVEYSDFQCPYCSRFHPTLVQVMDEYKGKVRWVYRHFPLTSIHPYAQKAAEASECANEQGKFWEIADQLFATQDTWTAASLNPAALEKLAKDSGVKDVAKFTSCVTSGKYAAVVQADEKTGETAGVTGTPGTIVIDKNGKTQMIPGALPYDSVKQIIDAALAS